MDAQFAYAGGGTFGANVAMRSNAAAIAKRSFSSMAVAAWSLIQYARGASAAEGPPSSGAAGASASTRGGAEASSPPSLAALDAVAVAAGSVVTGGARALTFHGA